MGTLTRLRKKTLNPLNAALTSKDVLVGPELMV